MQKSYISRGILTFLFLAILGPVTVFAQAPVSEKQPRTFEMKEGDTTYVMKRYVMVMLYRGDKAGDYTKEQLNEMQAAHLENINRLAEMGKIQLAGPFGDDTALRGIFIMDCESVWEAQQLVATDPMIKAGRLRAEMHPWWGAVGTQLK